ncbi:hypothetical protein SETIT_8G173300v2 [Setaria italica]|uniref:Uncharacterized protein n=2 Tax=Setaria italica TaxID=4555 RepID=A0A368S8U5_SETIT|nr:hypothetical protein SETIT_8G173300v2 [Setaria italica]
MGCCCPASTASHALLVHICCSAGRAMGPAPLLMLLHRPRRRRFPPVSPAAVSMRGRVRGRPPPLPSRTRTTPMGLRRLVGTAAATTSRSSSLKSAGSSRAPTDLAIARWAMPMDKLSILTLIRTADVLRWRSEGW